MEAPKDIVPIRSVHARFYDRNLHVTTNPKEAFETYDDTQVSRFVAAYDFELGENALVISLSRIIIHFFNPAALLDHIDYISSPILEDEGSPRCRFREMPEMKREFILTILHLVVVGGGVVGKEKGEMYALWSSASFRHELGYSEPDPSLSQAISKKIRRQLSILFGHQPKKSN